MGSDGVIFEIEEEKLGKVKYHGGTKLLVPGYLEGLRILQKEDFFWLKLQIELQTLGLESSRHMHYLILLSIQTGFYLIQISICCMTIILKALGIHLNTKFLNDAELIL
ncbi:hypothetical protein HZS_7524 [Henneguya salminicola]|nr:hypothetical protein HZS_7524 [Henneguya salminicola]